MIRNVARTLGARVSLKAATAQQVPSGITRAAHGAALQTASTVGAAKGPAESVRRLSEAALGEGFVALCFTSVVFDARLHPLELRTALRYFLLFFLLSLINQKQFARTSNFAEGTRQQATHRVLVYTALIPHLRTYKV